MATCSGILLNSKFIKFPVGKVWSHSISIFGLGYACPAVIKLEKKKQKKKNIYICNALNKPVS